MKIQRKSKGSILLEAIIALAAIMVTVAAIATVVTVSVSNSTFVKNQNLANKHAQEGMEAMRSLRERNYAFFKGATYPELCYNPSNDTFSVANCSGTTTDPVNQTGFKRRFSVAQGCNGQPEDIEVTAVVSWSSGRCDTPFCHKAQVTSCFAPSVDSTL